MLWVDNFSKTLARAVPTLDKGVYSSMLWTGECVMYSPDFDDLDDSVKRDDTGSVVPAMPDDLMVYRHSVTRGLKYLFDQGKNYYDRSLMVEFDVRNNPPKIDSKKFPHMKSTVDARRHTMDTVYPEKLVSQNIGSNPGLLHVLRHLVYEKYNMHEDKCERYVTLNLDENIYWRTLKV